MIAGRASPGWQVSVQSGETKVAAATADDQGEWSAVLEKPLAAGDHALSLTITSPDGTRALTSQERVRVEVGTATKPAGATDTAASSAPSQAKSSPAPTAQSSAAASPSAPSQARTASPKVERSATPATQAPSVDVAESRALPAGAEEASRRARRRSSSSRRSITTTRTPLAAAWRSRARATRARRSRFIRARSCSARCAPIATDAGAWSRTRRCPSANTVSAPNASTRRPVLLRARERRDRASRAETA